MKDFREPTERFVGFVVVMMAFALAVAGVVWFACQNVQRMLGAGSTVVVVVIAAFGFSWFKDRILGLRKRAM